MYESFIFFRFTLVRMHFLNLLYSLFHKEKLRNIKKFWICIYAIVLKKLFIFNN